VRNTEDFNTLEQFHSQLGGALLVNKPKGWTSFDVVNKLRGTLRLKKIGHAGTLDPLATGLLILCSQKFTKEIDRFQALDKTYEGEFILGATTPSFDAALPPENIQPFSHLEDDLILDTAKKFVGQITQLPPMYSAVKVDGKRLYSLARKGLDIERKERTVQVMSFTIRKIELPSVSFQIVCSKGTYVRTIVHDLGQELGCGAYLSALCRTGIGPFSLREAWEIDTIVNECKGYTESRREGDHYASV
jgi:tRNA pseudouridine55 synthase